MNSNDDRAMRQLLRAQPSAAANLDHWGKLATWKLKEALPLSLGLDPRRARDFGIPLQPAGAFGSWMSAEHGRRVELIWRAEAALDLPSNVRPKAFIAWMQRVDLVVPADLERCVARYADGMQSEAATDWPWGSHTTRLLRLLDSAARKFWTNYDPNDPTTAPKSDEVSAWLESQGASKRVAESMAQMLRADGLKRGPR